MKFQNIQNSKIYKIYRKDELNRLSRRIQQIKQRKNKYLSPKDKLPFISSGYGFSPQRKRQIQKQNQRLQQKIKKCKQTHSDYFLKQLNTTNMRQSKVNLNYTTNRCDSQNQPYNNQRNSHNILRNLLLNSQRNSNKNYQNNNTNRDNAHFDKFKYTGEKTQPYESNCQYQQNENKNISKDTNKTFLNQILKLYEQTLSSSNSKNMRK